MTQDAHALMSLAMSCCVHPPCSFARVPPPLPRAVIVAVHSGLKVVGFSILTDMCLPDSLEPTSLGDVMRAAQAADDHMARLMMEALPHLLAEVSL